MQTCFEATCCEFLGKDKGQCNAVCPYKSDFADWLSDAKGLRFDDCPPIAQPNLDLPLYIPVIDHRSRRRTTLEWPVVALRTSDVLRLRRDDPPGYRTAAKDAASLRRAFLIGPSSRIILRGVADDAPLERYWENRLFADAPGQLARLGVDGVIGPNFSHLLDVPRTDNLFNRRRQILCLDELQAAGLPVIPHLNAVMPADWRFWCGLLERNPTVRFVAVEFQTGNKHPVQGRKTIKHLASIQREIGRPLHPIIVGGGRFIEDVAAQFGRFTLMDSMPFAKAIRRQVFDRSAGNPCWGQGFRLVGQDVDDYLFGNVSGYSAWIAERVAAILTRQSN